MRPDKFSLHTANTPEHVCNMAVSYLGRSADLIHSLSAEADLNEAARACMMQYDNTQRAFLSLYSWSFAIKEMILKEYVLKPTDPDSLKGSYIKPSDWVRILAVGDKGCGCTCACACNKIIDHGFNELESKIIPCRGKWIRYIYHNKTLEQWSPMAIKAFALMIAREVAGPITMDNTMTNSTLINKAFVDTLGEAKKLDGYSTKVKVRYADDQGRNEYSYRNFTSNNIF